jgi:hypothetical protein
MLNDDVLQLIGRVKRLMLSRLPIMFAIQQNGRSSPSVSPPRPRDRGLPEQVRPIRSPPTPHWRGGASPVAGGASTSESSPALRNHAGCCVNIEDVRARPLLPRVDLAFDLRAASISSANYLHIQPNPPLSYGEQSACSQRRELSRASYRAPPGSSKPDASVYHRRTGRSSPRH